MCLLVQEEEEWQEVLAQQGAWQQAPATNTLGLLPQSASSPSDAQQLDDRTESGMLALVTADTSQGGAADNSQGGAADGAAVGPQGSTTLALVPVSADQTDTAELVRA